MYFEVDLNAEPASVRLADADNFRAFQIEASGPRERIAQALEPYGQWDGDHAWLKPTRVRELAGERARQQEWQHGFKALQTYAAEHGYLREDGLLRAHVEWQDEAS